MTQERNPMKKRILFVDDDTHALSALRSMVGPMEREWRMSFAEGGSRALELLARDVFDVVVTDLGMPEVDGRQVLERVRDLHPMAVRMAFSGPGDLERLGGSLGVIHQALSKTCGLEELIVLVGNALRLGGRIEDEEVKGLVGRLDGLPAVPRLYQELRGALEEEQTTVKGVAEIIRQDMAMSIKILSMVNSAFFGLRRTVESLQEAVAFLGTETIKVLVLAHGLFGQTGVLETRALTLEDIWRHSLSVAKGARALAAMEGLSRPLIAEAFMGGMLHDVGILILAKDFPERYDRVVRLCAEKALPVNLAEQREFGLGHPEVGAYALGLWGIQPAVLKAVSLHHAPSALRAASFNPLLAIHLADHICGAKDHHPLFEHSELDERALGILGLQDHLAGWRKILSKPDW